MTGQRRLYYAQFGRWQRNAAVVNEQFARRKTSALPLAFDSAPLTEGLPAIADSQLACSPMD